MKKRMITKLATYAKCVSINRKKNTWGSHDFITLCSLTFIISSLLTLTIISTQQSQERLNVNCAVNSSIQWLQESCFIPVLHFCFVHWLFLFLAPLCCLWGHDLDKMTSSDPCGDLETLDWLTWLWIDSASRQWMDMFESKDDCSKKKKKLQICTSYVHLQVLFCQPEWEAIQSLST